MPDDERIPVWLTRVDAQVTYLGLKEARRVWIADVRKIGGQTSPTPYDDAISAIAEQLRAQDAEEAE